jgi:hypothetical protein
VSNTHAVRSRRLIAVGALIVAGIVAVPAMAAPGEDDTPIGNPDLPLGCGIDIHVILDESGSIENAHATGDVRQAFGAPRADDGDAAEVGDRDACATSVTAPRATSGSATGCPRGS